VRIRKMDENDNGVRVRVEVQDEGIGIDEAAQSRLFQPFQQADASTTRVYGGTGLGLSICRQLAELMDEGEVGVKSTPGQGSTFWFTVRLKTASFPHAPQSIANLPANEPAILNGARILLADDHPLNCEVASAFLEHAGAIVSIAHNGREALDQLKQQRFDCVLLDIQMPVMDGFETIRLMRGEPKLADIPVIAMTASLDDRNKYLSAGMNDFISKPFDPAVLYATLAKWLEVQPLYDMQSDDIPLKTGDFQLNISQPASRNAVIDLSVLSEWIGDDKKKLQGFVLNFVKATRQDLIKIDAAFVGAEFTAIATLSHHVSSPARMVGAIDLADLCRALEAHARTEKDIEQMQEIVSRMHAQLDLIDEFINNDLV
jgi:two-component system sensor histidine kinase/response regulator